MMHRATQLGLHNSSFKNASGWPEEGHHMTVRDIATLSRRLIKEFPQYYGLFAEKTFTYNGIRQGNRNPLLYKDFGADGLKTGHTQMAGYGLAASAVRNGRRLILVIHALTSVNQRAREAERLLDWGFREFGNYALFKAGERVDKADVWLGTHPQVDLVLKSDLTVTLSRKARRAMTVKVVYEGPIPAPISAGQKIAQLVIGVPDVAGPSRAPLCRHRRRAARHVRSLCVRRWTTCYGGQQSMTRSATACIVRDAGEVHFQEGGDGAGKSTQVLRLCETLGRYGIDVIATREPGGTPGAERIRSLLLDGPPEGLDPVAEALLHFAARRGTHCERRASGA